MWDFTLSGRTTAVGGDLKMLFGPASVRRTALLAAAAILLAAGQAKTAQAVEMRDIAGWWLAIDDTFPKHWKTGAMTPMEEVLQINPDGRVTDRVMNFWAGSHRACLENKVCSDVPQVATARVRVSGDKLSFSNVVASNARLDTPESGRWLQTCRSG